MINSNYYYYIFCRVADLGNPQETLAVILCSAGTTGLSKVSDSKNVENYQKKSLKNK